MKLFALGIIACVFVLFGCSKPAFKSEVGLFGIKQYHVYAINAPGDTSKLANAKFTIVAMNNNYLTWNNITFKMSTHSDSVSRYINDTTIDGVYKVQYSLEYLPKTDQVTVWNYPTISMWRSF